MTVKCLLKATQQTICERFEAKTDTINQLADLYGRSRRTIIRVLEDHGIDAGVKPRNKQLTMSMIATSAEFNRIVAGSGKQASLTKPLESYSTEPKVPGSMLFRLYGQPAKPSVISLAPKPWYRRLGDAIVKLMADGSPVNLP